MFGGAALWPFAGHAKQPERMRRVGWLVPWPEDDPVTRESIKAFQHGLRDLGWIEGKNIRIDYCFAKGEPALQGRAA